MKKTILLGAIIGAVLACVAASHGPPLAPLYQTNYTSTNLAAVLGPVLSGINSNALDVPTKAQLALAGAGGGSATNAIGATNGVGYGLTVVDSIRATNFIGNGISMTNVAGLSSSLSNWVTGAASGTSSNAVTNIVFGIGPSLTNLPLASLATTSLSASANNGVMGIYGTSFGPLGNIQFNPGNGHMSLTGGIDTGGTYAGNGSGLSNIAPSGILSAGAMLTNGWSGSTVTISNILAVDYAHMFSGSQVGLTNGSGQTIPTQISNATNGLGTAAFKATGYFDISGAAQNATNPLPTIINAGISNYVFPTYTTNVSIPILGYQNFGPGALQGLAATPSANAFAVSGACSATNFVGNQAGLTNGAGNSIATQIFNASNSLVATFSFTNAIITPFTNVAASGTVWISPTNGNLQCYVLTNSGSYLCPLFGTRSADELIRFTIYSTNLSSPTYYMPASNVFNSALAVVLSATNIVTTSFILDHDADASGTNLYTVFRLK